jgi:diguanylate cyclase (GGDEF)-like protein
MDNMAARNRRSDQPTAGKSRKPDRQAVQAIDAHAAAKLADGPADVIVDTAVVVNNLDRLISGRVNDLAILNDIAQALKAGASKAEIHRRLLVLARSSREAFQSLQSSRDALVSLHKQSADGEIVTVIDEISGLPNKVAFEARLDDTFRESAAAFDTVLMLVDVGALQILANEAGVQAANRVVKRFSTILRKTVKRSDFVARIGPQRFAVIFHHVLPDNVAPIARRIHEAMQAGLSRGRDPVMQLLSVTIGITGSKAEDRSSADLLQRAQDSLIVARKQVGAGIYIA